MEFANYAQYDPDGRIRIRNQDDSITCSEREMQKESCYFKHLPHFGYTGAFRSTITGLSHMGARWYSARLGQFISPDPLWYIDSFDLYAYAGFDPINKWDPTGLASAGLGDNASPHELRSSLADQFRRDRDSQFRGIIGTGSDWEIAADRSLETTRYTSKPRFSEVDLDFTVPSMGEAGRRWTAMPANSFGNQESKHEPREFSVRRWGGGGGLDLGRSGLGSFFVRSRIDSCERYDVQLRPSGNEQKGWWHL